MENNERLDPLNAATLAVRGKGRHARPAALAQRHLDASSRGTIGWKYEQPGSPYLEEETNLPGWRERFLHSIGPVWIACGLTSYAVLTFACHRWLNNPRAYAVLREEDVISVTLRVCPFKRIVHLLFARFEVARSAQERSATIFCTALAIDFINLLFEGQTTKMDYVLFPAFIKGMASSTNLLTLMGGSVLALTPAGRVIVLQRYICWMHTTPSILMLMKLISTSITAKEALFAIACDEVMIITGAVAALCSSWGIVFWGVVSHLAMLPVFFYLHKAFREAISATKHGSIRVTMWTIYGFMMALWTAFGINWDLAALGWISTQTEEVFYLCCDFGAKVMFSSTLMLSSFKGMEARREDAMRSIEEGSKQKLIGELRRLLEQKERFLSSVSHELRTPLNGIIGISEGMLSGCCGVLGDQVRRQIYIMRTSGARLLTLINDVMDASALRSNQLVLHQKRILLRQIVDDVLDLSRCLVDKEVELHNLVPPRLLVLGDADRIVQIMNNLLGNAAKFTRKGHIKVSARMVEAGRNVAVTVTDTGIGMAHSKLATIFLPFEQVDTSIVRKYGGFGLGLNIVQELVKAHGGEITVDSVAGRGTRITFTLPSATRASVDLADSSITSEEVVMSGRLSGGGSSQHARYPAAVRGRLASLTGATFAFLSSSSKRTSGGSDAIGSATAGSNGGITAAAIAAVMATNGGNGSNGLRHRTVQQRHGVATAVAAVVGSAIEAASTSLVSRMRPVRPRTSASPLHGSSARSSFELEAAAHTRMSGTAMPEFHDLQYNSAELSALSSSRPYDELLKQEELQTANGGTDERAKKAFNKTRREGALLMVVSGEEDNHAVTRGMLGGTNVRVIASTSGEVALARLEEAEELPDCIMLDVMLPGSLQGYDVVHEIRDMETASHIPIIMVSTTERGEEEELATRCLECGADDFVRRPLQRAELLSRLTELVGGLEANGHLYAPEERSSSGSAAGGDWTILCVDDDEINQLVVQGILRGVTHRRCRYIKATSAAAGLSHISADSTPPDLVLLDCSLPDMSGFDACRCIRSIRLEQQVTIIMMSSRHSAKGVEDGLAAGANDFLTKPIRRWELQSRILMHLKPRVSVTTTGSTALSCSSIPAAVACQTAGCDCTGFHGGVMGRWGGLSSADALLSSPTRGCQLACVLVATISDYSTLCRALSPEQLQPILSTLADAVSRLADQFGLKQVDGGGEGSIALLAEPSNNHSEEGLAMVAVRQYNAARLLLSAASRIVVLGDHSPTPLFLQLCLHFGSVAAKDDSAGAVSPEGDRPCCTITDIVHTARQYCMMAPLMSILASEPAASRLRSAGYGEQLVELRRSTTSGAAGSNAAGADGHDVSPAVNGLWLVELPVLPYDTCIAAVLGQGGPVTPACHDVARAQNGSPNPGAFNALVEARAGLHCHTQLATSSQEVPAGPWAKAQAATAAADAVITASKSVVSSDPDVVVPGWAKLPVRGLAGPLQLDANKACPGLVWGLRTHVPPRAEDWQAGLLAPDHDAEALEQQVAALRHEMAMLHQQINGTWPQQH